MWFILGVVLKELPLDEKCTKKGLIEMDTRRGIYKG